MRIVRQSLPVPGALESAGLRANFDLIEYRSIHEELLLVDTNESGNAWLIQEGLDLLFLFLVYAPFHVNQGVAAGVLFLPSYSAHLGDLIDSPMNFFVWQVPALLSPGAFAGGPLGRINIYRLEGDDLRPTGRDWVSDVTPMRIEHVRVLPAETP